ncbi:peroxiredoxin [Limnobacter sp.]|uniref:peroxiredoxin n=1 Tax=Limnobacter sp. TaxID=2003368 RepID=UPI0035134E0D
MTIQVGEKLPSATLYEFFHEETGGCALGPNKFDSASEAAGKKVAILALPGAYTPTCSAKHLPGFINKVNEFKAKGIDEIWCISVNDAFVMGAWGKELGAGGKVRMMADGVAEFTKAIGMELDLSARGLGIRSNRYSMLVEDGVVKSINLDPPGTFEHSSAEVLLQQLA